MPNTTIKTLTQENFHLWDNYVTNHPEATSCHLSGWKTIIEKSFGHHCHYIYVQKNNKIHGVLPIVLMKSRLFGSFLISMPFLNYGGILADNNEIENLLLDHTIEIAKEKNVDFIELRHNKVKNTPLEAKQHKVAMLLELPEHPDILWKNFNAKVRNQVRKAEMWDLQIKNGRQEKLNDFFEVFSINMRDLGTPVYSKKLFKHILNEFSESRIFVVDLNKSPIASGFVIGMNGKLDIPWAASIREFNPLNGNMLLYWNILKYACENNYHTFDFGRCTPNESHFRFKKQWGSLPVELNWHYWMANGNALPDISPKNLKYRMFISGWKKMPITVSRIIGPSIVKNIP